MLTKEKSVNEQAMQKLGGELSISLEGHYTSHHNYVTMYQSPDILMSTNEQHLRSNSLDLTVNVNHHQQVCFTKTQPQNPVPG